MLRLKILDILDMSKYLKISLPVYVSESSLIIVSPHKPYPNVLRNFFEINQMEDNVRVEDLA